MLEGSVASNATSFGTRAVTLWRFSRPHTVIGTTLSAMGLYAMVCSLQGFRIDTLWSLLLAILLPGFLLEIVRRSAEGDDTMPDWPDPTDFGARASDWLKSIAVVVAWATPPAATPYSEWRGKPPSQPSAWAGSRLFQSGLPLAWSELASAGVTMSSTGVGGRWPTVCSMPAIQNG